VVLAAFFWGVSNILQKRIAPRNVLNFVVWSSLIPPIPLFLLSLVFEGKDRVVFTLTHWTASGVGSLLYIGWMSTAVGFALWGYLLKTYSANRVAPFSLLVPFFGVSAAHFFLGESFTPKQLVGSLLVVVGLFFNTLWKRKKDLFHFPRRA
jgi:O-acetylserine/cysteine efflux transporter